MSFAELCVFSSQFFSRLVYILLKKDHILGGKLEYKGVMGTA